MNIKEKLEELDKKKLQLEKNAVILQQKLNDTNRDYLVLIGKIGAFKEIHKEFGEEIVTKV